MCCFNNRRVNKNVKLEKLFCVVAKSLRYQLIWYYVLVYVAERVLGLRYYRNWDGYRLLEVLESAANLLSNRTLRHRLFAVFRGGISVIKISAHDVYYSPGLIRLLSILYTYTMRVQLVSIQSWHCHCNNIINYISTANNVYSALGSVQRVQL